MRFAGVYSVLPTPFLNGDSVDRESLKRVVDLFIPAGVNGVTALGITGEVARLNDRERNLVLETVTEHVNGRITVIAGASADGTQNTIQNCRGAVAAGANAVMISPPRLAKLNSDTVVNHYKAVASAVDIPVVIQDYPPQSGYTMEPALLARIAQEIPQARTIKLEDPPTPSKTAQIRRRAEGIPVDILGGLGGVYLFEELVAGASGVMTGFSYPEMLVEVVRQFRAGEAERAAESFYSYVPLMRFEFQEGIGMAIRKELLRLRGAVSDASTRAPGPSLDPSTRDALQHMLSWVRKGKGKQWISA
jgi:4-hydroxy-tetrahydrodipicolinate synthase